MTMEELKLQLEQLNDPSVGKTLKETYGIIVYQEQIMQILQIMAGFSLGKADLVRRAIGKKELEKLQSNENDFINGAISRGYSRDLAKEVFNLIVKFY